MSFEPAAPINIVVCDQCHGSGCDVCDRLGVYGLKDDQPVGFMLPDFIDLKARKFLKRVFIAKRVIFFGSVLLILFLLYGALGN